jgi:arylsulfatase
MKSMKNPNIIVLLVDALRPYNLGCFGYKQNISPAIDKLAEQGVVFEKCFACSNASDPALTSIMSGMQPRTHGILHHSFEVNDSELKTFEKRNVRFLQEILKDNGYNTYGLDFLARWHARGYDHYPSLQIDRTKRKKLINRFSRLFGQIGLKSYFKKVHSHKIFRRIFGGFQSYPSDEETTQKAIELIGREKEPFFLFAHYWGVHKPFKCPDVENKLSLECYDKAIKTVDGFIEQISKAAGDDTIIVVLGDHGESLGEHEIYYDHHGLYDPSIHVPLIISGSSVPSGKRVNGLVSVTDIFGSILSLAGIKYSKKTDSLDLTPYFTKEGEPIRDFIFAEENYYQDKVCIRTEQYKFIKNIGRAVCELCKIPHGDDIELYDLKNDPGELKNIASENSEMVASFEKQINKILQSK